MKICQHRAAPRRLAAVLALLAAAVLCPAPARAQGDPLGHRDRAASLYGVVVAMDGAGNPLLPVSVLRDQDRLEVVAPGGLRILGTGDGQVEFRLPPGREVEITAAHPQPGVYQHFVVVAQAPADDFDTLRRHRARWKDERSVPVRTLATGATYSLAGRMLDTRKTLLCLQDAFATEAAAQARATELEKQYGEDLHVHAVVGKPPGATLVARSRDGAEVRAADVLWFEAERQDGRAGTLRVVGSRRGGRVERELPGRIYVVPGPGGGLDVVNEAELERILEGVVASEIFASAPAEALRAQAVAARTDMLAKVGTRHGTDPFAICSEVHCQAYNGTEKVNPRIAQAVADTRGLVMVDTEGRLVDAFYHAVSGGHTENNENVWPGRPQPALRGRADLVAGADDPLADGATDDAVARLLAAKDQSWAAASGQNLANARWTTTRSQAQLAASLRPIGIKRPVLAMTVLARGVSGRATAVELALQGGARQVVQGELRIRRLIGGSAGPSGLRSSLFLVRPAGTGAGGVPAEFVFQGAGFGHGVGMCQTGATARARSGQDFRTILGHYYAGSKIEKLY